MLHDVRRAAVRVVSPILYVLVVVTSAGCSAGGDGGLRPDGAARVLAAETFLADIAQNIAGDRLVVDSLLAPGIDPHEYQATPKDAIRIADAQVLIVNGLGYESWLDKSLEAGSTERLMVQASAGVVPASDGNPHLWMNPRHVMRYAENIRIGLSEADPGGASLYAANTEAYDLKLHDLDAWIEAQVAGVPAARRMLITNHHALESFAEAYGFKIAGVVIPGFTSEAATSAQQMAELIRTIKSLGAPAIFLDVSEKADLATQIAAESGAEVVTGLYVETLSEKGGPAATYIDMMKYDVRLIVEALK
jgi:ABC-type Zn uptake system ZnuABC Zn-binding protein ZnuA